MGSPNNPKKEPHMVKVYSPSAMKPDTVFRMSDGAVYGRHETGALVRTNKDRRSPKARKRARRELREQKAKAD